MLDKPSIIKVQNQDIELPTDYRPSSESEEYMGKLQLAYFKKILLDWRTNLNEKSAETLVTLSNFTSADRSSEDVDITDDEVETLTILRSRDRHRKLMQKIDEAILRIETGSYGYCEKSGEEIGIRRLLARPIATLSIDMQKIHEEGENFKEDAEHTHKILEMEERPDS